MNNNKIYKQNNTNNNNMIPGDPKGSPDESFSNKIYTLVFIDIGFLSKLSKYFGGGKYLNYDIIKLARNLSNKQNLECKHIFYYSAPPFQSDKPTLEEENRKKKYDKFISKFNQDEITIREGRCQRLKIDGKFIYKQKGVDALAIIDLMSIPLEYPKIKKIILIATDSDFVPIIQRLNNLGIKTILYTYFDKNNRKSIFSTSNELIKSVHKYIGLTKQDFYDAKLEIKGGKIINNKK